MPRRARKLAASGIYHITMRAVNRQQIFEKAADYRIFLSAMEHVLEKYPICYHGYCLMGNHVHLLVEAPDDALSDAMKVLEDCFVYRYNHAHERCGVLFQGRFYSVPIENNKQFLTVLRYIHQNPMRAGLEEQPGTYPWSSFYGYFHPRSKEILCRERVLGFFPTEDVLYEFLRIPVSTSDTIRCRTRGRIDDELVIKLMCELTGCSNLSEIRQLSKENRNSLIRELRSHHLSANRIARLIGLSATQVQRIVEGEKVCTDIRLNRG